jgi:hypothetical protein
MFRRLVYNVRAGFPDLLTRPFEVSALHQHIIPYRLNRRELGIDSAEEYELTLMRLLAGTRGLLNGDPDMQAALKAELESPNPDLSLFRAFGTSSVSLAAAAIRALDGQSPPAVRSPSPASPTRQAEMAGRATIEVPTSGGAAAGQSPGSAAPAGTATLAPPSRSATPAISASAPMPATRPAAVAPQAAVAPPAVVARPIAAAIAGVHGTGCRYCAGELPEGRETHFCPHCGQNLSIKQCPACSTELEAEWQYCITCGRQVE